MYAKYVNFSVLLVLLMVLSAPVKAQSPMPYSAYVNPGSGWTALTASGSTGQLPSSPEPVALYAYNGTGWIPWVGPSGGSGSVTSFSAGTLSPLFTTSVATATTTPALSFSLSNAAQNSVFAGPASGGAGAPSYQTAPTISAANMTNFPACSGNNFACLSTANAFTNTQSFTTSGATTPSTPNFRIIDNETGSSAYPFAILSPTQGTSTDSLFYIGHDLTNAAGSGQIGFRYEGAGQANNAITFGAYSTFSTPNTFMKLFMDGTLQVGLNTYNGTYKLDVGGSIRGTSLVSGTDNSAAGSLQLANGSAAAHTIFTSAATTTNTIAGFATAPTTGDLINCTTASTTCTLTDAGFLASAVVRETATDTTTTHVLHATASGAIGTFSAIVSGDLPAIPLSGLATQATNTIVGNATSGTAVPTALAIGSCDTASSAVTWTTNTGFGCNTAINAGTVNLNSFPANGGLTSGQFIVPSSTTAYSLSGVNLTWVTPTLTIGVAGTTTGILKLGSSTATGSVSITPAAAASAFTATLPAATDTIVELTQTQTLTNKSLALSEVNSGYTAGGIMGASSTSAAAMSTYTANAIPKMASTATTPTASSLLDDATDVVTTEPLYTANGNQLNGTTATSISSTSFVTTGIAFPPTYATTARSYRGYCHVAWSQATAANSIQLGINTSAAPVHMSLYAFTAASTGTLQMTGTGTTDVTTATTTSATGVVTALAANTRYMTDIWVTLAAGAAANTVTLYGLTTTGADALLIEPGTFCTWLP